MKVAPACMPTRCVVAGSTPFFWARNWVRKSVEEPTSDAEVAGLPELLNAYVLTLKWIQQHSAAEIADKCPPPTTRVPRNSAAWSAESGV
jgi:hypothetical protein